MTELLHGIIVYLVSIDPPQMVFWSLIGIMFKWMYDNLGKGE